MNNIFKALIAGYGAKKLGGGCFGTILVFVIIWVLLGQCGAAPALPRANGQVYCSPHYGESCENLIVPHDMQPNGKRNALEKLKGHVGQP